MKAGKLPRTKEVGVFRVRFWGVRGSYPTPDETTLAFGGHTSCVEACVGGHRLIFDAGTGIIPLGRKLTNGRRAPKYLNLFLSHTHHDHVFGFYFFDPLFRPGNHISVFGPGSPEKPLQGTLRAAMEPRFFPVKLRDLDANSKFYSLQGGERVELRDPGDPPRVERASAAAGNGVTILVKRSRAHPNGVLLYRVHYRGKSVVYATDVEQKSGGYPDIIRFIRGADVLIHDAQYLSREYHSTANPRKGWGHSTVERAAEAAKKGAVKKLVLFHHEPTHDDETIEAMEKRARRIFPGAVAAYEGMKLDLFRLR
jgi:phosphoribosyl 1,2-cyclic phosphodiesterase